MLESGGTVERETRLYDADRHETRTMRSKELSDDYRYFPDPDLLPLALTPELIEEVAGTLPELPEARFTRFVSALHLSEYDAGWLTQDPDIADYFEATLTVSEDAKLSANWVMGELSAALNRAERAVGECPVAAVDLGVLIQRINDGTISSKIAKTVFDALWAGEGNTDDIIESRGLKQMSDSGELKTIIDEIVRTNPQQAEQFRQGKEKVLGFFVGQVMKATSGKANPKQVNELLRTALSVIRHRNA